MKFLRSRSLAFCANCQHLGVSNFCKVVGDFRSRFRILKGKKSLRLAKKNASLAVTLSLTFTIRHPLNNKTSFPTALFVSFFLIVNSFTSSCERLDVISKVFKI